MLQSHAYIIHILSATESVRRNIDCKDAINKHVEGAMRK